MELVITIPKEFEAHFKQDKFKDSLGRICYDIENAFKKHEGVSGRYEHELAEMLDDAFAKAQVSQNEAKLKRALWLARASEASKEVNYWNCENESSYAIVDFDVHHRTIVSYKAPHHRPYKWILIWEEVERKCRAYANKFKEEK